jgi:hypothetical protein
MRRRTLIMCDVYGIGRMVHVKEDLRYMIYEVWER